MTSVSLRGRRRDDGKGERAGQTVKTTLFPITLQGKRLGVRMGPPKLGEHTRELLDGIGYSKEKIDTLLAQAAVA